MLRYARSDTHFLLNIYDHIRNDLIRSSLPADPRGPLINLMLTESKKVALLRYEYPFYDAVRGLGPMGWYNHISKSIFSPSREQFAVFRALHRWRDDLARDHDEGIHWTMMNRVLDQIVREMPATTPKVFSAAQVASNQPLSQPVKERVAEIVALVQQARDGANDHRLPSLVLAEIAEFVKAKRKAPGGQAQRRDAAARKRADLTDRVVELGSMAHDVRELVAGESVTWGKCSFDTCEVTGTAPALEPRLVLRLPEFTTETIAMPVADEQTSAPVVAETPEAAKQPRQPFEVGNFEDLDDVFVAKNLGGKRKRTEDSVVRKNRNVEVTKSPGKKAKRAKHRDNNGAGGDRPQQAAPGQKVLGHDFYSRAMDVPTGLGKSNREKVGKSTSYK